MVKMMLWNIVCAIFFRLLESVSVATLSNQISKNWLENKSFIFFSISERPVQQDVYSEANIWVYYCVCSLAQKWGFFSYPDLEMLGIDLVGKAGAFLGWLFLGIVFLNYRCKYWELGVKIILNFSLLLQITRQSYWEKNK